MGDSPRYTCGEMVVDADDEDPDGMIVIDSDRGRAADVFVEALGASVAEANPEYPPGDRVVRCVMVPWLDRHVGDDWRNWPAASFGARLEGFVEEWRIPLRAYDYPESRLAPVSTDERPGPAPGERPDAAGQSRLDDWFASDDAG